MKINIIRQYFTQSLQQYLQVLFPAAMILIQTQIQLILQSFLKVPAKTNLQVKLSEALHLQAEAQQMLFPEAVRQTLHQCLSCSRKIRLSYQTTMEIKPGTIIHGIQSQNLSRFLLAAVKLQVVDSETNETQIKTISKAVSALKSEEKK